MTSSSSVQQRLERVMRARRLSCRDVEEQTGVSFATVSRARRGRPLLWSTAQQFEQWLEKQAKARRPRR